MAKLTRRQPPDSTKSKSSTKSPNARWVIIFVCLVLFSYAIKTVYGKYSNNNIAPKREVKIESTSIFSDVKSEVVDNVSAIKRKVSSLKLTGSTQGKVGFDYRLIPGFAYPRPIPGEQIVRHTAYTLSYNEGAEEASWVAYKLRAEDLQGTGNRKDDKFRPDPMVTTGSATAEDYKKSGYDRGHLAPAGDMKRNEDVMAESFLMSNITPQAPQFNRGIWEKLETKVRTWARVNNVIYITCGPELKPNLRTIGNRNRVSVPDNFYKVVLDVEPPKLKMIGFWFPNTGTDKPLSSFVVSVDEIERLTGIDFYPALPDKLEAELEASSDYNQWN